jgi:undecaprenyl-diphosphatase
MSWWEALFYGIIQGATEFLPVSSSGHLAIAHRLGLSDLDESLELPFDVLLHAASLLAIVIAFRSEILQAVRLGPRFWLLIVIAAAPAGLVGLFGGDLVAAAGKQLIVIACCYIFTAILLSLAQIIGNKREAEGNAITELSDIRLKHAASVGGLQVAGLFPGVSRSGSTIAGGLLSGLAPAAAVPFSFLVGLPLIAAAAGKDALDGGFGALIVAVGIGPLAVASISCFAVSWGCIIALKLVVARRLLHWFAGYCALLAIALFVLAAFGR